MDALRQNPKIDNWTAWEAFSIPVALVAVEGTSLASSCCRVAIVSSRAGFIAQVVRPKEVANSTRCAEGLGSAADASCRTFFSKLCQVVEVALKWKAPSYAGVNLSEISWVAGEAASSGIAGVTVVGAFLASEGHFVLVKSNWTGLHAHPAGAQEMAKDTWSANSWRLTGETDMRALGSSGCAIVKKAINRKTSWALGFKDPEVYCWTTWAAFSVVFASEAVIGTTHAATWVGRYEEPFGTCLSADIFIGQEVAWYTV